MRVLLTNDDGIGAAGLNVMRRALLELPGIELSVIAPNSNRSAIGRSITTRSPLWVEEIEFADGSIGYATDGTPVDCVRFAALGLVGHEPELIVFARDERPWWVPLPCIFLFPFGLFALTVRNTERIVVSLEAHGADRTSLAVSGTARRAVRKAFAGLSAHA